MTKERVIEVLETERACVQRQSGPGIVCDRNCASCDLLLPEEDVLAAYDAAISAVKDLDDCRNELCLNCGSYRYRHEGACNGCRWRTGYGN